jgi:hypothetical protein
VVIDVDVDHLVTFKKIEEVINNAMKGSLKRKPTKNKKMHIIFPYLIFWFPQNLSKRMMWNKKMFLKYLHFW